MLNIARAGLCQRRLWASRRVSRLGCFLQIKPTISSSKANNVFKVLYPGGGTTRILYNRLVWRSQRERHITLSSVSVSQRYPDPTTFNSSLYVDISAPTTDPPSAHRQALQLQRLRSDERNERHHPYKYAEDVDIVVSYCTSQHFKSSICGLETYRRAECCRSRLRQYICASPLLERRRTAALSSRP